MPIEKIHKKRAGQKNGIDVIILAAGYATRLYPLTLDRPKPLLTVAGRPTIEYIIERLHPDTRRIYMVINEKFADHFRRWREKYVPPIKAKIEIINDGSKDESDKLGAIGDLNYVLQKCDLLKNDLIVVAGDNIFSEKLTDFYDYARRNKKPAVAMYDVGSLEEAKRHGNIKVGPDNRVLSFVEKPLEPEGSLIAIALYYYPREILPLIRQYISEGNNPDQPGRFVQWLYQRVPVYGWRLPGVWYDIGTKETLKAAEDYFSKLKPKN